MFHFYKSYFVCIFFVSFISILCSQVTDFNITGAGARAAGFGGAFIGVADDATAISWNPAGLAKLEKLETSVVGKYSSTELDDKNTPINSSVTTIQKHKILNFVSCATPIVQNKIVGAIAWQQEIDGYYKQAQLESKGSIDAISFGGAISKGKIMSYGIAGNIWTGEVKSHNPSIVPPFKSTENFSGFNLIIGAMADLSKFEPTSPIKIGLVIRTPFDLKDKYNGTDEKSTFKLEMPWMIGMGASYRFNDMFRMSVDFESRLYSNSSFTRPDFEDDVSISEHDLNQVRVGAEYLIQRSNYKIPLRLGLQTVPTVYSNLDSSNQERDQVIGSGAALGTGITTNLFSLDTTITAQTFQQKLGNSETLTYTYISVFLSAILYF